MKIVQVMDGRVHWVTPYQAWADVPEFAPDIVLAEAPEDAREGWGYVDGAFVATEAVGGGEPMPPDTV